MKKTSKEETLVLTKDVKNPKPDRRYKRDWRFAPVWKKGTKFVVEVETDHSLLERCKRYGCVGVNSIEDAEEFRYTRVNKRGDYSMHQLDVLDPRAAVLVAALKPTKKDLNDALGYYSSTSYEKSAAVLQQLVDNGTLNFKQIERAVAELDPDHTVLDSIVMAVDEVPE